MSDEAKTEKFHQISIESEASQEPIRTQPVSELCETSSTEQVIIVPEVPLQHQYAGMTVILVYFV